MPKPKFSYKVVIQIEGVCTWPDGRETQSPICATPATATFKTYDKAERFALALHRTGMIRLKGGK
jgi:hypothetical protein